MIKFSVLPALIGLLFP